MTKSKTSSDMSMKVWPGMKEEPTLPTLAVIYTLDQSKVHARNPTELGKEMAIIYGDSFRMYEELDPTQGYRKAVIKAQTLGYVALGKRGYGLTPKGLKELKYARLLNRKSNKQ